MNPGLRVTFQKFGRRKKLSLELPKFATDGGDGGDADDEQEEGEEGEESNSPVSADFEDTMDEGATEQFVLQSSQCPELIRRWSESAHMGSMNAVILLHTSDDEVLPTETKDSTPLFGISF